MDTAQSKSRLLLVDGDLKSLRVLDVSLKKAGFDVTTATSGREALALLETSLPDLIISDTDLDEMDGFELCRQIKARPDSNKIPFLFVSGRKSIEDKIRGLELGVDDYLSKPIYIKEIGIRVRTALQRAERERMESRREGRTRFAGDLSDVGVVDLVQTIELNRKSGIIHIVNRDNRRGSMFFRDGKVVDAEVGRLSGAHAVYRLFSWSEGQFAVEFKQIRRHDVIDTPMAPLLMEGMRRLDETTRLLEKLPSLRALLEVDCRVLAEELAELPDEMNSVLRLCDGTRTLQEVVEDSDHADLEALTILSKLIAEHVIFAREASDQAGQSVPSERLAHWLSEGGAENGGPTEEPTGSADLPAQQTDEDGAALRPAGRPPARTLKLPAITTPVVRTTSDGAVSGVSGEDTLGAALPARDRGVVDSETSFARAVDTLKGVPIDSLFAGLAEPTPEPQAYPASAGPADPLQPLSSPGQTGQRPSRPAGLAERMLSDDSAVRASAMHEAVSDGEGTIANSLPIDRNTREYGSPDEAAAALVDEVVSGSQEAKPVKPVVEPARPSKEVDWGVWSTGQSNCEGAAVPGLAFLPGGAPMKPEDSARFDVAPGPSPLPLLVAEPITAATEPVAILPPQPVALLRPPALPTVTGASTRVPPAEARAGARSPSNVVSRIDINADSKLDPPAHLANSRRMWLWTLGAFAAGLLGFVAVSRRGPEPAAATPPGTATSVGAAPSAPRDPAAPSAQQLHTPLAPKPSHGDPPTPATDRPALRSKPPSQPQSGVVTAVPNLPAVADLHRRCVAADDDGKGKAKVVANVCRPALDADPKDVDVMVILARAELDRGRLAEARTLAKRALGVDAQRVDAYIYLGNVEQEAGKVDDARAAYKKYLELAPNGPFARELRAILSNL